MILTLEKDKQKALARHLKCTIRNLSNKHKEDYLVLTNQEADEKAHEYIKCTLWAFNPLFIIQHTNLPSRAEKMIRVFQEEECELANETIEKLIEDFEEFVQNAINADGRGHFISFYDGKEHEIQVNGTLYYIYRLN